MANQYIPTYQKRVIKVSVEKMTVIAPLTFISHSTYQFCSNFKRENHFQLIIVTVAPPNKMYYDYFLHASNYSLISGWEIYLMNLVNQQPYRSSMSKGPHPRPSKSRGNSQPPQLTRRSIRRSIQWMDFIFCIEAVSESLLVSLPLQFYTQRLHPT